MGRCQTTGPHPPFPPLLSPNAASGALGGEFRVFPSLATRIKTKLTPSNTPPPFHHNNFKLSFTPVSRCFSSFPHGTCSLSVSRRYLALEDTYLPLCAALPSNATLGTPVVLVRLIKQRWQRGSHPLWRCVPADLTFARAMTGRLEATTRTTDTCFAQGRFQA